MANSAIVPDKIMPFKSPDGGSECTVSASNGCFFCEAAHLVSADEVYVLPGPFPLLLLMFCQPGCGGSGANTARRAPGGAARGRRGRGRVSRHGNRWRAPHAPPTQLDSDSEGGAGRPAQPVHMQVGSLRRYLLLVLSNID